MNPADTDKPRWFCVRTQTKREHIAAKHLRDLAIFLRIYLVKAFY